MKDIVFLFGAGASNGAGGTLPEQPPLSQQLYPILERIHPRTWGGITNEVKEIFQNDFEAGMQLIHDRYGHAIPVLMREMAIYFIQFRPYNGSTLYCRLLSDLRKIGLLSRVLLSTLNYECVLEFSLLEQGHKISYFDEGDLDKIPVWKLHGSCNMFSHRIQAGQGVSYGTGVVWEGGAQAFLDPNLVIQHCLIETGLAPVMCLYMKGKLLNVSPSVIFELQRKWREKVETAEAVVCIGVRPLLEDTHIWEPLSTVKGLLYFIGEEKAFKEWYQEFRKGETVHLGSRFNEAYIPLIRRLEKYGTQSG